MTYVTSALPSVTPVDLGGRAMVAPPSEARKCVTLFSVSFSNDQSANFASSLSSHGSLF